MRRFTPINHPFVISTSKKRVEQMKEITVASRKHFILSHRWTGKEQTLCHLDAIPSGCFRLQDIGCVSGNMPAFSKTYWITDNLGMDRTSTDGVYMGVYMRI